MAYHEYAELYGEDEDFKKFVTKVRDSEEGDSTGAGTSARPGNQLGPSVLDGTAGALDSSGAMQDGGGTNGREASARAEFT